MENGAHPSTTCPDTEQVQTTRESPEETPESIAGLMVSPWPLWFTIVLAVYCAALPVTYGGMVAESRWLLPWGAWLGIAVVLVVVYLALFRFAGAAWTRRTGMRLRFDVLPRPVALALQVGYPIVVLGMVGLFRLTGNPVLLFATSALGAALAFGFHLWFVRLRRAVSGSAASD